MNIYELNIKSVLDIPEWEKLQDQFARLTGTAIVTIDYKGNPVTKISECSDFCAKIRDNPATRKRCSKCDALAGLEAVRLNKPFIYQHCLKQSIQILVRNLFRFLKSIM